MDLDALREDLKYWDDWSSDDWPLGNLSNVLAAARAVLDSEEAWWCTVHVSNGCTHYGADHCKESHHINLAVDADCSMVRVRLLAEEGT